MSARSVGRVSRTRRGGWSTVPDGEPDGFTLIRCEGCGRWGLEEDVADEWVVTTPRGVTVARCEECRRPE